MKPLALCASFLLASNAVNAAEFSHAFPTPSELQIYVNGQIEPGDDFKFQNYVRNFNHPGRKVIILNSPGGDLDAGINMGLYTNTFRWETFVKRGMICASACGLVWLAGKTRWVQVGAHIGFHAVHYVKDKTVSSGGNAMVGAFMRDLGLGYDAINYLTSAPPNAIEWLTSAKAREYRINAQIVE